MPKLLVIPGDGIGIEVTTIAVEVLKSIGAKYDIGFEFDMQLFGGASIDAHGVPVTEDVLRKARESDAVILGAVGGPKWDKLEYDIRPEMGLLALRKELDAFANLRPAVVYPALADASTLKREVVEGVDIMVVRELTGGIYFGTPKGVEELPDGQQKGVNTLVYTTGEIERVARVAFGIAMKRGKKLTSVDKANVLDSMELWRRTVTRVHDEEFPEIALEHLYVDNAAMQLIRRPATFDVILAGNLFGDIISDEAAQLTGSLGMIPSASVGDGGAIYEPVHGSAPDIAGRDLANPAASVLSAAMMLKYSLNLEEAASCVENAVRGVLDKGLRTGDIYEEGMKRVGCREMGAAIIEEIEQSAVN